MSSRRYRKYKNYSKKLFHPSISLNHEPTFSQKRGMVLQRSVALPSGSITSRSRQDDVANIKRALKSNILHHVVDYFQVDIIPNDSSTYSLNYETVIPQIKSKYGLINDSDIIFLTITDFTYFDDSNSGGVPLITYSYNFSNLTYSSSYSTTTSSSVVQPLRFTCPDLFVGTSVVSFRGPKMIRKTDKSSAFITDEVIGASSSEVVWNFVKEHKYDVSWYLYAKDVPNDFINTLVSIDNNGNVDTDKHLRFQYIINFIK